MRKILFKGKRIDNGRWIYGSPIFQDGYVLIRFWNSEEFEFEEHLIAPESVSEYTGLTDKNGNKIFEGDIVKHHRSLWGADNSDIGTIQWCQKTCKFYRTSKFDTVHIVEIWEDTAQEYEVIGNIHDNPELLKESDN